jgi:cystathionine gamma-synthase
MLLSGGAVHDDLHPDTIAISAGRSALPDDPTNPPVVLSSTFRGGRYARAGNPTWSAFEEALGALEGGRALAFGSGMAAISATLERLPVGSTVVVPDTAYHGTRTFLAEAATDGRLTVREIDITDTTAAVAACDGAELLWAESPTNPLLGVADLTALAEGAHRNGALVCVDNTFATPLLQRPLDLGADVVVHSVTKYIGGHSDVVLGAAVTQKDSLFEELHALRTHYGGIPGPMETFLALRGLRTLPLRMERAQHNASILAERLSAHQAVERVRYPGLPSDPGHELAARQMRGFGAMLSFEVAGGAAAADKVVAALGVIVDATSLGSIESTLERRSKWPGEEAIPPGLLRFNVGCEHVEDLWADLSQALDVL